MVSCGYIIVMMCAVNKLSLIQEEEEEEEKNFYHSLITFVVPYFCEPIFFVNHTNNDRSYPPTAVYNSWRL